jgi:hypothetical protein
MNKLALRRGRCLRLILWAGLAVVFASGRVVASSEVPESVTAQVRSRIGTVSAPDRASLARALGLEPPAREEPSEPLAAHLRDLGDLDGDGHSEYELVWTGGEEPQSEVNPAEGAEPIWSLLLLSWDGTRWQASPLMSGFEPFEVHVLPSTSGTQREIAVIVLAGATEVPFPAVFEFQTHAAKMVWDGRSDASRYQGFDNGRLEFRAEHDVLQMVETGRADPGLLVFPKNGRRGFEARTVYNWSQQAFIPVKTEYAANEDYALYRFISALHLHDFRTAYALTDSAKLLKTEKPDLKLFRKYIEDNWPELLDDKIFRARDLSPGDAAFTLSAPDKVFVYTPQFSGTAHLLSGLSRQEHKP